MSLPVPNLDDRRFDDLMAEARRRIQHSSPGWTDLSANDPGVVLLEAFAHLTELMIYRLNRIPEKAFIEFLRLIGVQLQPPSAAVVTLRFTASRKAERAIEIPRGTRVATDRSGADEEAPVFSTAQTVTIEPGQTEVEVRAYHCEQVEGELLGQASGEPGFTAILRRAPIVAPTGDGLDLVVAVQTPKSELDARARALQHEGKSYRIWREVDRFAELGEGDHVYMVDRLSGSITFAPALQMRDEQGALADVPRALAAIPPRGRELRAWYRTASDVDGNVAADTLTLLKDPIAGLSVTNPAPATGGRPREALENAIARGPLEIHSLRRAVTARDFEALASRASGAVARSKATTPAMLWKHGRLGTVEMLMVPHVPEDATPDGFAPQATLSTYETDEVMEQVREALELRRPLGTQCLVNWTRYKPVRLKAQVVVTEEEDPGAVRQRVLQRLNRFLSPLPSADSEGWPYGESLTAWQVYRIIGEEPGVQSVGQLRMVVDEVPSANVTALASDEFQPNTWYAGSTGKMYRSMNDGTGWEPIADFGDEQITAIEAFPVGLALGATGPGLVAVATLLPGEEEGARLRYSTDCGESWQLGPQTKFGIDDLAWILRDGAATLLLATDVGLYEVRAEVGGVPLLVLVDPQDADLGFYAVAVAPDPLGDTSVAVAARGNKGVYLSATNGTPGSFKTIGLDSEHVRVLEVQHHAQQSYLWAGTAAPGSSPGHGCFRWRFTGSEENPEGWRSFRENWDAGGCRAIAFKRGIVFAATQRRGVLRLNVETREPAWELPDVTCGLPFREVGRYQPIHTVATDDAAFTVLAGLDAGVFRSQDEGVIYEHCSKQEFSEFVTLPKTWLFCSGEHDITVVREG